MDPTRFNDADGNFAGDIGDWLVDNGYHDFVGTTGDDDDVCGNSASDGWGFIDFQCIEAGYFHIDILPPGGSSISQGLTLKFFCAGQADTATIGASRSVVEIEPQAGSDDESLITVTVLDPDGRRIDNVEVQFLTDNCYFTGQDSPAGGQPTVVTAFTDTDATSADQYFLTNNPLEHSAGTAEVVLNCSKATAGDANVRAVIQRAGADIVLDVTVKVVGPTAANGLTLTLAPKELQCGDTLTARAQAVDVNGEPVSDGTTVRFTSDTSSGVVGGFEGAQGGIGTVDGSAQGSSRRTRASPACIPWWLTCSATMVGRSRRLAALTPARLPLQVPMLLRRQTRSRLQTPATAACASQSTSEPCAPPWDKGEASVHKNGGHLSSSSVTPRVAPTPRPRCWRPEVPVQPCSQTTARALDRTDPAKLWLRRRGPERRRGWRPRGGA